MHWPDKESFATAINRFIFVNFVETFRCRELAAEYGQDACSLPGV